MYRKRSYRPNLIAPAILFLLVILTGIYFYIEKSINPYIREYCINEVEFMALESMNQAVIYDMEENADIYNHIAVLNQNKEEYIVALSTDTYKINKIKTSIMKKADTIFNEIAFDTIYVQIGNIYNNFLLFNRGVEVPAKMVPMSTVKVDFYSSFENVSINQSIHRIIMECIVEIDILLPFEKVKFDVTHKIAISETVIVGNIPDSYTYIEDGSSSSLEKFNHYAK